MTVGVTTPEQAMRANGPSRAGARPALWRELSLGLALFGLYALIEAFTTPSREFAAQRHGEQILALERALHIDLETPLNEWLARHPDLQPLANYEYAITYIVSALWLLIWLYRRRPDVYRWARNSFVLLNLIAFGFFALHPTAPPRMLPGEGFVDTVRDGHTWFSWGSSVVSQANQLAAMPSLHLAWALWVSVVLACISGARWVQGVSAFHVLITALVIMATANHYLLDAVAAAPVIWLALAAMSIFRDRPGRYARPRVATADAFFLHAESESWPQHVGGVIVVAADDEPAAYRDRLRAKIIETLPNVPRFTQRLWWPSNWRRPRWTAAGPLDWDWHVPVCNVSRADGSPGGYAALWQLIARLQEERMPRDRPLWRWVVVGGFEPGKLAAVILVHHSVSDGIGTVAQAVAHFEPVPTLAAAQQPALGALRRSAAIMMGLAQLAADGRARGELPNEDSADRWYGGLRIPVSHLRDIARRHQARVTDVLLSAVTSAVREELGQRPVPARFRIATPLMVRTPESAAEGNLTAAVITEAPLVDMDEAARLAVISRLSRQLRTGARALASRFVLSTGIALLPPPAQAWFTRAVYGRRYFQAIVSNMPGPATRHDLAGANVEQVFPILPLASGTPLVVGGLSWERVLHLGITAQPVFVADMDAFVAAIQRALDRLAADVTPDAGPDDPRPTEPTRSGA